MLMTQRRQLFARWLFVCIFIGLGLIAYAPILDAFFLSDDFAQIGKVLAGDWSVTWGREHGGFFRPLFIYSYIIDTHLWGQNPRGFHLTNLTLHAVNTVLVLLLARRLLAEEKLSSTDSPDIALASSLIFLLHPSHTEAVSWISGRGDLIATLFGLLSLLAYLSFARTTRRAALVLSLACFAAALLAKESAICLLLLICLIGIFGAKRSTASGAVKQTLRTASLFILVLVTYVAWRGVALGALIGGYGASQHLNFTHSVVISQLLRSFLRVVFPALVLRSFPLLESRALSPMLIVLGGAVALVVVILVSRPTTRRALFARVQRNTWLWKLLALFICSLLPVLNLRINVFDTQGERYLYLPSVFAAMALALIVARVVPPRLRWLTLGCFLCFYACTLWKTNQMWEETATLSQGLLDEIVTRSTHDQILILNAPDNLRGVHLYRNGLDDALKYFQSAKEIKSTRLIAFHGLSTGREEFRLERMGAEFTLRPAPPKIEFEKINEAPECMSLTESSRSVLRFRFDVCAPEKFDLFYFSGGRMRKVN